MRVRTSLLAVLIIALAAAPALGAVGASAINENADAAHNPYIDVDVEKAEHTVGWEDTRYLDNNGDQTSLPAELNSSVATPYEFTVTDLEADEFGEFPRDNDDVDTWANDSHWSTDDSSGGSVTVSETTTAPDVDAIQVSTSSQTDTDTVSATFDGAEVTSDAEKRYVQVAGDVNSLDSAATVEIQFTDADGDYVSAVIDDSEDASTGNTMANATGEGYLFQQQVGTMDVSGSGDGTMQEIQSVDVVVNDGNADLKIAALNAEKMGQWDLGETERDTDGDDDMESVDITSVNESGAVALTDLGTLGGDFNQATIHSLTLPMHFESGMQDPADDYERWNTTFEDADQFAAYDQRVNDYRRIGLPDAYDLSYSNAELKDTVEVPSSRYQAVEYATDVGSTNFSEISYTETTSSYSSVGDNVTLASNIGAGDEVALYYDYVVTGDEASDMQDTSAAGGAPMAGGGGGFLGGIWGSIAAVGGSLATFFGLNRIFGSGGSSGGA